MPRDCTVCVRSDRSAIDATLRDPEGGVPAVLKRFGGLSRTAIRRHRDGHLANPAQPTALAASLTPAEVIPRADAAAGPLGAVAGRLDGLAAKVERLLDEACAAGDAFAATRAAVALRPVLRDLAELTGELKRMPQSLTVNVFQSPEYVSQMQALARFADRHPEFREELLLEIRG